MKIRLADQLPGALGSDPFVQDLTSIFDRVNASVLVHADSLPWLADVGMTPDAMVKWMTAWLGVDLDDLIPADRARLLLRAAGSSYAARGTCKGLELLLGGLCRAEVTVEDSGGVSIVDNDGRVSGAGLVPDNDKTVVVTLATSDGLSDRYLVTLLDQEMPADVAYTLFIGGRTVESRRTKRGHGDHVEAESKGRV